MWTLTNQPHIAPTESASDSDPDPKGKGRIVEVEIDTEDDDVEVMEAPRVWPRQTKRIKARVSMSIMTCQRAILRSFQTFTFIISLILFTSPRRFSHVHLLSEKIRKKRPL